MGEVIAGGRTVLFVPMIPADQGLDKIVGSIERSAQVDIIVAESGAILKDRHGDAGRVLAELGAGHAYQPLRRHLEEVLEEAVRQDDKVKGDPPELWQPDRHGVRMFLTSLEDEIREALEAWDGEKKPPGDADPARWPETRAELVQVAAIALRAIRSLGQPGEKEKEGSPDAR